MITRDRFLIVMATCACMIGVIVLLSYRHRTIVTDRGVSAGSTPATQPASTVELQTSSRVSVAQSPDESPGSKDSTWITVLDRSGRPIVGAAVRALHNRSFESLGTAGLDGRVQVGRELQLAEGDALVASMEGYATGTRYFALPCDEDVVIVLGRPLSIVGVVRLTKRLPAEPTQFTVVGIPQFLWSVLPPAGGWASLLCDPRILLGSCEEDGAFVLAGAAEGIEYEVTGGGAGRIHDGPPIAARGGSNPIELLASELYGASVALERPSVCQGELPIIGGDGWGFTSTLNSKGAQWCTASMVSCMLAGVPVGWADDSPSRNALLATTREASIAPITANVRWHMLGYEGVELDIGLRPFVDGPSSVEVRTQPIMNACGWIVVDFGQQLRRGTLPFKPGELVLRTTGGETVYLPVTCLETTKGRVGPVPEGQYSWRFDWSPTIQPPLPSKRTWESVRVDASSEAVVVPHYPDAGSLYIELRDQNGQKYTGPARILIGEFRNSKRFPGKTEIAGDNVSFPRGPYLIPVLPSGTFSVKLMYPEASGVSRQSVQIDAAKESRMELTIQRDF